MGLYAKSDPDYMLIGAQKAGTTALFDFINQHTMTVNKLAEVHYFDGKFGEGIEWYRTQFPNKPTPYHICGDKSPSYLLLPQVPARVFSLYPDMKFLVVLRNPVDRAYSQYWMNRRLGIESRSFEKALEEEAGLMVKEEKAILKNPNHKARIYRQNSYLTRGRYAEQLERWFAYFPPERFLVVNASDLRKFPQDTMNEVFDFLGLSSFTLDLSSKDKHSDYPPMNPKTKQALKEYFKPYNEELEVLLGRKFGW